MTKETAKELLPVIKAWVEGRVIQFRSKASPQDGPWHETDPGHQGEHLFECLEHTDYRVKPEPRQVPWTQDDVPLDAVYKHRLGGPWMTARWWSATHLSLDNAEVDRVTYAKLAEEYLYITPRSATWQPCSKEAAGFTYDKVPGHQER